MEEKHITLKKCCAFATYLWRERMAATERESWHLGSLGPGSSSCHCPAQQHEIPNNHPCASEIGQDALLVVILSRSWIVFLPERKVESNFPTKIIRVILAIWEFKPFKRKIHTITLVFPFWTLWTESSSSHIRCKDSFGEKIKSATALGSITSSLPKYMVFNFFLIGV